MFRRDVLVIPVSFGGGPAVPTERRFHQLNAILRRLIFNFRSSDLSDLNPEIVTWYAFCAPHVQMGLHSSALIGRHKLTHKVTPSRLAEVFIRITHKPLRNSRKDLRTADSWNINHKRVLRMMREELQGSFSSILR